MESVVEMADMAGVEPRSARAGPSEGLRVLIVCEHASERFGGEASLPLHYFKVLRRRGVETWLIVHSRVRDEIAVSMPDEMERIVFLPDTWFNKLAWRVGRAMPAQLAYFTVGFLSRVSTQLTARRHARRMIAEKRITVVHQPIPVSPREPSLMHDLGAPVVIGPMNGNMSYPPGFVRHRGGLMAMSAAVGVARGASELMHRLIPGKLRAVSLLVANERTRMALPAGTKGEILTLVENGVDLALWTPSAEARGPDGRVRFTFLGRLVDWKAVDILLEAFARLDLAQPADLEIVGDGPMRAALEALADRLGVPERVRFVGWQPQSACAKRLRQADVLVLPSLYECGGAVVLEAMASSVPVIATDWGGPADYITPECGILVQPSSREALIEQLAAAMHRLALDPALRMRMGKAGRRRVEQEFDWEEKVDFMMSVYGRAAAATAAALPAPG